MNGLGRYSEGKQDNIYLFIYIAEIKFPSSTQTLRTVIIRRRY